MRREMLLRKNNLWHQLRGFAQETMLNIEEGWVAFAQSWWDVFVYGNGTVWSRANELEDTEEKGEL